MNPCASSPWVKSLTLQSQLGEQMGAYLSRGHAAAAGRWNTKSSTGLLRSHPESPYRSNLIAARPDLGRTRVTLFKRG